MQYVLSDDEHAFVDDLKKTVRSWFTIFKKFEARFPDTGIDKKKLQRCYSYKKNKLRKKKAKEEVANSPTEPGGGATATRKRKNSAAQGTPAQGG